MRGRERGEKHENVSHKHDHIVGERERERERERSTMECDTLCVCGVKPIDDCCVVA